MCELFAVTASSPVVVHYALEHFGIEGSELRRNRDGWGIMFAEDRDAHIYREAEPATRSPLARLVVERDIPCRHLMAHVRRASRGAPMLANTHPFTRVSGGRAQHFAHNGTLAGIHEQSRPDLLAECVGDTDSELAFVTLLDSLRGLPHGPQATAERFARFADFAARMARMGPANMLFFDGETLFAHAHRRIYETADGRLTPAKPPGLQIRHIDRDRGELLPHWRSHTAGAQIHNLPQRVILLASVPLNAEGWQPLPEGHAMALRNGELLMQASTA